MTLSPTSRRTFLSEGTITVAAVVAAPVLIRANEKSFPSSLTFDVTGKQTHGIAAHHQHLVVSVDRQLKVYSPKGELTKSLPLPRPARSLTFNSEGELYLGMKNELVKIDLASGQLSSQHRLESKSVITGISFAGKDAYISDGGTKTVWKVTSGVEHLSHSTWSEFEFPLDYFQVQASADGSVSVSNPARHRIERLNASGDVVSRLGHKSRELAGFSGCCNPVSFVIRGDGSVITAEQGIPRVKLFDADGEYVRTIAGPEEFKKTSSADSKPENLCVDRGFALSLVTQNRLAILDRSDRKVKIVNV